MKAELKNMHRLESYGQNKIFCQKVAKTRLSSIVSQPIKVDVVAVVVVVLDVVVVLVVVVIFIVVVLLSLVIHIFPVLRIDTNIDHIYGHTDSCRNGHFQQ